MKAQPFGRYELLAELGRGGMAELWLARLVGMAGFAKLVAIKRILPHLCDDARFVEMFLVEGRVAALLSHPNVCTVYELGEVDGRLFLAMEYLEGVSWEQFLTIVPRGDARRVRLAAGVLGQACDGLHYAHGLSDARGRPTGLVHRDVSPQNLFVTVDGVCKVLDFGVAKVMSEGTRSSTGLLKGKLPYMSPEQIQGQTVDPRADVFALGIVLWEALTGQRLFSRDTDYLVGKAVVNEPIQPVSAFTPYGAAIDAVVARALDRDRERRFPTIAALADALRDASERFGPATRSQIGALVRSGFAATLAQQARRVSEASGKRAATPAAVLRAAEPTQGLELRGESVVVGRKRSRWPIVAVAMVLAGGAAALAVAATRGGPEPRLATVPVVPVPPAPHAAIAAAPVDAAPELADAEPPEIAFNDVAVSRPKTVHHAPVRPAASTEPGLFSIESTPFARIYIDGKYRDQTPLFEISLPPGPHRVRAVLADGRQRTFTIQISPGAKATAGTLIW